MRHPSSRAPQQSGSFLCGNPIRDRRVPIGSRCSDESVRTFAKNLTAPAADGVATPAPDILLRRIHGRCDLRSPCISDADSPANEKRAETGNDRTSLPEPDGTRSIRANRSFDPGRAPVWHPDQPESDHFNGIKRFAPKIGRAATGIPNTSSRRKGSTHLDGRRPATDGSRRPDPAPTTKLSARAAVRAMAPIPDAILLQFWPCDLVCPAIGGSWCAQ